MGIVREFGIGPFTESATRWLTRPEERTPGREPRLAATVLLMRGNPLEVFMIERAATAQMPVPTWVFPGGSVRSSDALTPCAQLGSAESQLDSWRERSGIESAELATSLITAAIRELFEEAGVLLASDATGDLVDTTSEPWLTRRTELEARETSFAQMVDGLALRPDLLAVVDRWVTPEFESRRFDAWFFAALLPEGAAAQAVSRESQRGEWVRPQQMLARAEAGEIHLLPPTRTALIRMGRSSGAEEELQTAKAAPAPFATHPVAVMGDSGPYLVAEVNL